MDDPRGGASGASIRGQPEDRLDSWKKIASYLKRDVSTVQRWERREAMPVHRHLHDKLGSVFAYRSELDGWWESRRARLAQESERPAAAPGAAKDSPDAPAPRFGRAVPLLALTAALLLVAGAWAWFEMNADFFWRNPIADARFTRLPGFAGTEQAAAISGDGKFVAFLAERDGRIDAWAGELGSGSYRNLTHGEAGELVNPLLRALGFSADASLVTIWSRTSDGSRAGDINIVTVPPTGGPLRTFLPGASEVAWSSDGKRLVYHTTAPGDPLFVRVPGNAADRRIYVAPAGVHCHFPIWSPDDEFIYFSRGVPPDNWDIWRIRPSGAGLERITTHNTRVTYPVMLDRRTLVYLATEADGSGPWMYAVDVERRRPHRISSGLESYTSLAASTDGTRLVATIANARASVWRMSLGSPGGSAGTAVPGPSLVAANAHTPRLSGDSLLYLTSRGERQGLVVLAHGVSREIWRSSAHARIVGGPAIAPDGRHLALSVDEGGKTLLYVMENDGSHVRIVDASLPLRGNPAWAPDGQSVVSAVVRNGEPRLTRIFLNGDAPLPLMSEYSLDAVWSPDGRFLVYSGADVGTTFPLRAAAADGRPDPLPSLQLTRGARRVAFLGNQQALVFLGGEIGHKNFWLFDLRNGEQRLLAELPAEFITRDFDVSADGSDVVFDRLQVVSELALIERTH